MRTGTHGRIDTQVTVLPADDAAWLRLVWLASPALPVGGFSYSEGLEAAVEASLVVDEASARRWLVDQLEIALARAELPLVAAAHGAWQRHDAAAVRALNDWQRSTRETQEQRLQTEQMGRSLVEWLRNDAAAAADARLPVLASLAPAPTWPIAFAFAAVSGGAPLRPTLLACAFGWSENMVQAALKAVPLGQGSGQRMLAALAAAIPSTVDAACRRAAVASESDATAATADAHTCEGRQSFAPMLAILSAQHETQYSRLFRS